jgi:hypothetical protein
MMALACEVLPEALRVENTRVSFPKGMSRTKGEMFTSLTARPSSARMLTRSTWLVGAWRRGGAEA